MAVTRIREKEREWEREGGRRQGKEREKERKLQILLRFQLRASAVPPPPLCINQGKSPGQPGSHAGEIDSTSCRQKLRSHFVNDVMTEKREELGQFLQSIYHTMCLFPLSFLHILLFSKSQKIRAGIGGLRRQLVPSHPFYRWGT